MTGKKHYYRELLPYNCSALFKRCITKKNLQSHIIPKSFFILLQDVIGETYGQNQSAQFAISNFWRDFRYPKKVPYITKNQWYTHAEADRGDKQHLPPARSYRMHGVALHTMETWHMMSTHCHLMVRGGALGSTMLRLVTYIFINNIKSYCTAILSNRFMVQLEFSTITSISHYTSILSKVPRVDDSRDKTSLLWGNLGDDSRRVKRYVATKSWVGLKPWFLSWLVVSTQFEIILVKLDHFPR